MRATALARRYLESAAKYTDQSRSCAPAEYLLGRLDEAALQKRMKNWVWRTDVEYWKGEKARREGRKGEAAAHYRETIRLAPPSEWWLPLDARDRLKELEK